MRIGSDVVDGWTNIYVRGGLALILVVAAGCAQNIERIDLHDETIPADARRLVADAEDSIAIARAKLDEAERELRETRTWRSELLDRDWPSGASSAVQKLSRLADGRVKLARLRVERAAANVELARAKFELITAKTAIRNDLAVYDLEPLRKRVDREKAAFDELDRKFSEQRNEIAQLENEWWSAYASFAKEGDTRFLYVSAAEELAAPDLRDPEGEEGGGEDGAGEESKSESGGQGRSESGGS